jgi:hypothetical protein
VTSLELTGIDELRISNIARWTDDFTPAPDWYRVSTDFTVDFWVHLTKVRRDGEDMIFVNGKKAESLSDLFDLVLKTTDNLLKDWDK